MSFEQSLAEECVDFALFFGINPHYLVGVAKFRSNIQDDVDGVRNGPFRLTQAEWDANRTDTEFAFAFAAPQITSWRRTCDVFALMTYRTQNVLLDKLDGYPSAVELYEAQWPNETSPDLANKLKIAFDATAALIAPAAATLDDPDESGGIVTDPSAPITPVPTAQPPIPSSFGTGPFRIKAPRIMRSLMNDLNLTREQSAGILGNLGQESGGLRIYHEIGQPPDKGGVGWAQWTASRRRNFEAFCKKNKMVPQSDQASYEFLKSELTTTAFRSVVGKLKLTASLSQAVILFEELYEIAGAVSMESRQSYGQIALDAFNGQALSA